MFAEGVELESCELSVAVVVRRDGEDVVQPVADARDVAQHVNDGELASLELSLIAPLPAVSVGGRGRGQRDRGSGRRYAKNESL